MGPTCSIIYENEPMEKNTMSQKPRLFTTNFFNRKELAISVLQGLVITFAILSIYQYAVHLDLGEQKTRTMVFTVLIAANIFLTLVNRSFFYSIITTIQYRNNLVALIIGITIAITGSLIYISPLASFFKFGTLNPTELFACIGAGFLSVVWYELVKLRLRKKGN